MSNREAQYTQTVARWVVSLCEPLISTSERAQLDEQMSALSLDNAEWLNTWFAGTLCSTVLSLPREDPWRKLSAAFYPANETKTHIFEFDSVPIPQVTGARSKGKSFGTRRDHTDMIVPEFNDWLTDLQLAAVTKELDPWSSTLVGFAGGGFDTTRSVMNEMHAEIVDQRKAQLNPATKDMFYVLSEALKYVIHRRRAYVGSDDEFVWSKGFQWIARTDQIISGRAFSTEQLLEDIVDLKVPDGDYAKFRLQ